MALKGRTSPFRVGGGKVRYRRNLAVALRSGERPLTIRFADFRLTRMTVRLPPAKEGEILPILDRWAKLIPQVRN